MPLLTGPQKAALATLARTAFAEQTAQGKTGGVTSDQFRKIVVHNATEGRATGLTSADRDDYLAIRRELLTLAGRDVDAFETALKESTHRRDQILFCVKRGAASVILGKLSDGWQERITDDVSARMEAYISKIVTDRFDTGENWRDDLTEKQLIELSITLANRAAAKRKKAAAKAAPISAE